MSTNPITHLIFKRLHLQCSCSGANLKIKSVIGEKTRMGGLDSCIRFTVLLGAFILNVVSYIDESRPPILVFSPITHLIFKLAPLQLCCRWSLLKIKSVIGFVDM